jgi:hypothetical protein
VLSADDARDEGSGVAGRASGAGQCVQRSASASATVQSVEFALRTLGAVEDELVVRVEVCAPAVRIGGQPNLAALGAPWDEGNLLNAHSSEF